ncbi:MAG: Asp23/Gls24 family envelope stress response protein [Bacillota bacterium]
MTVEQKTGEGGKIIFASDVIATIAGLAASEVKGVAGMSGGVVEGITQILGRKNLTKGIKVEVGSEEAAVDVSVIVEYGYRIHEVCAQIQLAVKNAIETMTGLRVVEVNVFVQSVSFEKPEPEQKPQKALKEKTEKALKEKTEKEQK